MDCLFYCTVQWTFTVRASADSLRWPAESLSAALFAVIVDGLVDLTLVLKKKGVSDANGHARQCETVSHSSGPVGWSIGPAAVFWDMSRMHRHTAPGSRFRAPGPDRCKYSLTAHRASVPACPHLSHKQPGGLTGVQGTQS